MAGHDAHTEKRRVACGSLGWKSERHSPFRKPRRIIEDNIKMSTTDTGDGGVDWFSMAHDMDR